MEEISQENISIIIEENKFLKKLLKEAPVTIHINKVDENGHNMPVWANDNYEKLTGYTLRERPDIGFINGKSGIYYEEDAEAIRKAVKMILANSSLEESLIFRFYKKSGDLRWIYIHSRAITYKDDPNHFLSIGFDITEKLVFNPKQLEIYTREIAQLKNHIRLSRLTKTEKEIIKELTSGKTTKEIAEIRARSYETINNHRRNIFRKLEIRKINELVSFAKDAGLD